MTGGERLFLSRSASTARRLPDSSYVSVKFPAARQEELRDHTAWAWTLLNPGHDFLDGGENLLRVERMVRIFHDPFIPDDALLIDDDIGALCQAERGRVWIVNHHAIRLHRLP